MKAIMISIKPEWCYLTIEEDKTLEIRKGTALFKAINKLIEKQGVAPMFLYCTKDKTNKEILKKMREIYGCEKNNEPYGKVIASYNGTAEELEHKWNVGKYQWDYQTKSLSGILVEMCSRLCYDDLDDYLCRVKSTAIHINAIKVFDKPKELSEFKVKHYPQYAGFVKNKTHYELVPLTRAPQSYCYVEV